MRVLVTGGAGFIGSNLVDRLLNEGAEVDALDNLSTGRLSNLDQANAHHAFTFHHLDLGASELADLVRDRSPEVIFHLAAQSSVGVSLDDPVLDAEVNVLGTVRLLEAARSAGVRKVVYAASGGTLYGDLPTSRLPASEDNPYESASFYGLSKMVGVRYLTLYREVFGLDFTALALANVYGPRQDPYGEAGVVAIFCERATKGLALTVNGDGEQTRDFVFVGDVVDAFARATDRAAGLVVNIGTGIESSVNEIARHLGELVPSLPQPEHAAAKPGEVRRSALDPRRAREVLEWTPSTSLREGLERTYATLAAPASPG